MDATETLMLLLIALKMDLLFQLVLRTKLFIFTINQDLLSSFLWLLLNWKRSCSFLMHFELFVELIDEGYIVMAEKGFPSIQTDVNKVGESLSSHH